MTRLIIDHWPILVLASLLGFNAGLLAVNAWRYYIWHRELTATRTRDSRNERTG